MSVNLKVCSEEGLSEVAKMATEIWYSYYKDIISSQQINYMLSSFYSPRALREQIQEGQQFYFIQYLNEMIGFISVSIKNTNLMFIHKLYIYPTHQRKHLGTQVIDSLVQKHQNDFKNLSFEMRLTVNRQNFKAINFYFKNGFRIESIKDFDIGNGYFMNDFIMVKMESK